MTKVLHDTRLYWNQYHDVTDIRKTPRDERERTCGVTSVSMITGEHPDTVLNEMIHTYGWNDKFQWEELLIGYLRNSGFKCVRVAGPAYPKPRKVTDLELDNMVLEMMGGKVIFYHKKGHYQVMVGCLTDGDKHHKFIFNDPAGDRTKLRINRAKESGHNVEYPLSKVKREKIYGSCWSVDAGRV